MSPPLSHFPSSTHLTCLLLLAACCCHYVTPPILPPPTHRAQLACGRGAAPVHKGRAAPAEPSAGSGQHGHPSAQDRLPAPAHHRRQRDHRQRDEPAGRRLLRPRAEGGDDVHPLLVRVLDVPGLQVSGLDLQGFWADVWVPNLCRSATWDEQMPELEATCCLTSSFGGISHPIPSRAAVFWSAGVATGVQMCAGPPAVLIFGCCHAASTHLT